MSLAYVPFHSLRVAFVAVTCALVGSFVSPASFAWDLMILHVNDVHSAAAGVNDRGPVYDDTNAVGGLARVTAFVADEKQKRRFKAKPCWRSMPATSGRGLIFSERAACLGHGKP